MFLEGATTSQARTELQLKRAARHGWLLATAPISADLRSSRARLVVDDQSSRRFGWLAVKRLASMSEPFPDVQTSWLGAVARLWLSLLFLAIAWYAWLRAAPGLAGAALLAGLGLLFFSFRNFYQWDELTLLAQLANDAGASVGASYDDQFAPLFLVTYLGGASLARANYVVLQSLMLLLHVGVVLLLSSLLQRHGASKLIAGGVTLVFAVQWAHADVVPWYIEVSFLGAAGLTLAALRFAQLDDSERLTAKWLSWLFSTLAGLFFVGGIVAPWLVVVYRLLFGRPTFRQLWPFVAVGILLVLIASASVSPGGLTLDVGQIITYAWTGITGGSVLRFAMLSKLPSMGLIIVAVLTLAAVLVDRRSSASRHWGIRSLVFAGLWLCSAYALQSVSRSHLGSAQALSMRYSYFGMLGAAFLFAAVGHVLVDLRVGTWTRRGMWVVLKRGLSNNEWTITSVSMPRSTGSNS